MTIKSEKITIELSYEEARDIAYHILSSLKKSVDEHYISTHHDSYKCGYEAYAKPLLYKQEGSSIQMMKTIMASASGDGQYMEDDLLSYFQSGYKERNGSLTLESEA